MFFQVLQSIGVHRESLLAGAGAAGYALGQLTTVVFVTKLCRAEEAGAYALGVALATPVLLGARMQLRYVLAADVAGRLRFDVAAGARAAAVAAALAGMAAVALWAGSAAAWTAFLVALVRAAEDVGDLWLGLAQRAGEWPVIVRSQFLHGLGGAAALGLTLFATSSLSAALAVSLAWNAAVAALHDRRAYATPRWPGWAPVRHALRMYAPLGAAAALVSLNAYIPRYAIERCLGLEAVGAFMALAQLALVGNIAVQAMGQAAVSPLSRAYALGRSPFCRTLAGLAGSAAAVGVGGVAVAAAAGPRILAVVYRPAYAAYGDELVWLAAAAALTYLTAILGYALVAVGERRAQLGIFALSSVVAVAASLAATPLWGLRGAAMALGASWLAAALAAAVALTRTLACWRRPALSPTLCEWVRPEPVRPDGAR